MPALALAARCSCGNDAVSYGPWGNACAVCDNALLGQRGKAREQEAEVKAEQAASRAAAIEAEAATWLRDQEQYDFTAKELAEKLVSNSAAEIATAVATLNPRLRASTIEQLAEAKIKASCAAITKAEGELKETEARRTAMGRKLVEAEEQIEKAYKLKGNSLAGRLLRGETFKCKCGEEYTEIALKLRQCICRRCNKGFPLGEVLANSMRADFVKALAPCNEVADPCTGCGAILQCGAPHKTDCEFA